MQLSGWRRSCLAAIGLAGAVMLAPHVASAQTGKITGIVTDAQSGQPVDGVQIHVVGTGYGAITQSNGRYFIISVPPGSYTVQARRIGYQTSEVTGVQVSIDVTREVNFRLSSSANVLAVQRVVAPPTPLVEQGLTGSQTAISPEVISALPVTDVSGVLALQSGVFQVPTENTALVSFTDSRRNTETPISIRGGRGGETLSLIDGIPINNVVFGGPALDLTTSAVQQIDLEKGGFEPQYGNALSGVINVATKEGGTTLAGNIEYQSTGFAGQLGSTPDQAHAYDLFRGFLSGPVPGTATKVRFMVAGQQSAGRDQVVQFDQDVYNFAHPNTSPNAPVTLDLFPGWRGLGFDNTRQLFGKVTFLPTASSKLNLSVLDYERQRQQFDYDFLLTGFNVFSAPAITNLQDSLGVAGSANYSSVIQNSILVNRQLYDAEFTQRFGRSNLILRAAQFRQNRNTCNYFQGICLGGRFADINFNGRFVAPGISVGQPNAGTDQFFGGEDVVSNILRADLESQVTDHQDLKAGVFYQRHDLRFAELRNQGTNDVFVVPQRYDANPYEMAVYAQDRIEYDFLTLKLGARFDYAKAGGTSFANPLNPLNGTSATDVCNGQAPSLGATTPFTIVDSTTGKAITLTGAAACGDSPALTDSAGKIAQRDDFAAAKSRKAFSPRIGVNFPLTEHSGLFFNFGRYTQNPLYNNLYQQTGIGTVAGAAGGGVCKSNQVKPGTNECYPTIFADAYTPAFIGNPSLLLEQSTAYEVGYASEINSTYAINLTLFSKDETGLTGIRQSQRVFDIASTYGTSTPRYYVIVNQDYGTTRGLELQFRRRIKNYWGYDINYTYSKATTNAAPPQLQQQNVSQGDTTSLREIPSDIDQPHVFNASLFFRVENETPQFRWGDLLKHSYLTVTEQAASGLPYTPTFSFTGFGDQSQGDINSGRGPATFQTNLQAGKDFTTSNLRYGVFLRVDNLFDQKNCIQVFTTTGRCDAGTVDQRRAQNGNTVDQAGSTYFDRPEYFGQRRSIYAGLRVTF